MACRDGFVKLACKAILLYGGWRQTGWILGRFFWFPFFTFWLCAQKSDVSLRFPFVQPHSWICRFRFCKSQLLKNFWWKDWTGSRSDPWTWKSWKFLKIWKNWWNLILEVDFISIFKLWYWNGGVWKFQNDENQKKYAKTWFLEPGDPKICSGPALRQIFKVVAEPCVSFVRIVCVIRI